MIFISLGPRRAKCKKIMRDGPWFKNGIFKIMLPTRAGSTFSIFSIFHIDASVLNPCFDRHMGLSKFALSLVTCAQLSSWARTADTHHFIRCAFLRMSFLKSCSPLEQEAHFRFSALFMSMHVLSVRVLIATRAFQNSHSRS